MHRSQKHLSNELNCHCKHSLKCSYLHNLLIKKNNSCTPCVPMFEISARDVITADYTIIKSRSRVIMSGPRVIMSCMTAVHDFQGSSHVNFELLPFAFVQCIIKQLLDSVFVISRIIKVSVRVISLRLRLITLTLTLIILDITKTSSNNCL